MKLLEGIGFGIIVVAVLVATRGMGWHEMMGQAKNGDYLVSAVLAIYGCGLVACGGGKVSSWRD